MKSQNQKNKLATLSPQQSNPYTAKPEDFEVSHPDEFLDRYTEGGGQCGETKAEYERLIAQGNAKRNSGTQGRPTEPGDAGKPHTP
jgi:hypothetical protein